MKFPGILGMASFFGGLVLAVPMAIIGFEMLARDQPLFGGAFLFLAIAVLFVPEFIIRQLPSPRQAVRDKLPRIRRGDE